jgi:hypothetical protein
VWISCPPMVKPPNHSIASLGRLYKLNETGDKETSLSNSSSSLYTSCFASVQCYVNTNLCTIFW